MTEGHLMLKLGIIGTSWISHEFITAAHQTGHYHLQAVYSRKMKTAQEFCGALWSDLLLHGFHRLLDSEPDVVYIASPNSLHFAQAKLAILAKKHVIIEKPAVTTPSEWKELIKLANEHQVYLFEAARNYQRSSLQVVKTSSLTRKYWAPTSPLPNILLNCRPFLQVRCPIFSQMSMQVEP